MFMRNLTGFRLYGTRLTVTRKGNCFKLNIA